MRLDKNRPHQAQIDANNELAKSIKKRIVALEEPLDAQIKADEQRRAIEKAAKEQAERERVAAIRARIEAIVPPADGLATASSDVINTALQALIAVPVTEELFAEFIDEAQGVKMRADAMLCTLLRGAQAREAAAAELARQQAEIARQREELEAQQRAQREEAERLQREADERAAAERQRLEQERAEHEAKLRAEREAHERAVAEERAQAQAKADAEAAERERAADIERQRIADEAAASAARAEELKRQEDAFAEEQRVARQKLDDERAEMERKRQADLAEIAARQAAETPADDPDFREVAGLPVTELQPVAHAGTPQLSMVEAAGGSTRPHDDEILELLCDTYGVSESEALEWLTHFDVDAQVSRLKVAA
jgi:colicin import membrane protein